MKAREREQLRSPDTQPPTIADFWSQPHGVRLLLIQGDVVDKIASVVWDRGATVVDQRLGKMHAFPAHVGTLLSRRRRGRWSVAMATWFSHGWTKIQETTGGGIAGDEEQISRIASTFSLPVIGIEYDDIEEIVSLIAARGDGVVIGNTMMTSVQRAPRGILWHPDLVAAPTPSGISKAIRSFEIDIEAHVKDQYEMLTIRNVYGFNVQQAGGT